MTAVYVIQRIGIKGRKILMNHDEELVQCCRCRNKHLVKDRLRQPNKSTYGLMDLVCPRCKAQSYYKVNEVKKNV